MRLTRLLLLATLWISMLCSCVFPVRPSFACGVERWSVKTGTDADKGLVNLTPQSTTIATMVGWPSQSNIPANNRIAPYETQVWVVTGTLVEYKAESDQDYHLVIQDSSGHTMIAEIPDPSCLGAGSVFSSGVSNARAEFDAKYSPSSSFQTANIPVQVTGCAMFDFAHGQTGAAPNQIELHSVLDIIFNPGAGNPPPTPTLNTPVASSGSVALSWSASSGATSYTLYRATSSGTETSYKTGLTTTSYTDTAVTNGTKYYYEVSASNNFGQSPLSNEVSATPQANPDFGLSAAPSSVSIVQGTQGATTVTVSALNGFSGTASLSASGLSSGVTAAFNPASVSGGGTSTLTFTASAGATTGNATVTVTGVSGSLTHTATVILSVTSAGGGSSQLLGNPGFETGAASPWVTTSTVGGATSVVNGDLSSEPSHSGSYDAWLCGYGQTDTDTLYQQVAIPSGKTTATLTFWLHIDTAETSTSTAYDTLNVQVRSSSGSVLKTLGTFSNLNANTGYVQEIYNLSAYIGQTIRVYLVGAEDHEYQTSFVVDDLALNVQ